MLFKVVGHSSKQSHTCLSDSVLGGQRFQSFDLVTVVHRLVIPSLLLVHAGSSQTPQKRRPLALILPSEGRMTARGSHCWEVLVQVGSCQLLGSG